MIKVQIKYWRRNKREKLTLERKWHKSPGKTDKVLRTLWRHVREKGYQKMSHQMFLIASKISTWSYNLKDRGGI